MKCVYVRTDLYMKLHTELSRLCYLQANPDKFQTLTLDSRNLNVSQQNQDTSLNEQVVKNKDQLELFGVNVDDSLNSSKHISEVCEKASKKVRAVSEVTGSDYIEYICI